MGGFLKNVFVTAAVVAGGTAATAGVAAVALMIYASVTTSNYDVLLYSSGPILMVGVAVGGFFSIVSLFVAALTMPPVLGFARVFNLPRPATDMIRGSVAGWLCAAIVLNLMEELARAKGGDLPDDAMTYLLVSCGVLGGCLTGYWRHSVLVRSPIRLLARPFAA